MTPDDVAASYDALEEDGEAGGEAGEAGETWEGDEDCTDVPSQLNLDKGDQG